MSKNLRNVVRLGLSLVGAVKASVFISRAATQHMAKWIDGYFEQNVARVVLK